MSVQRRQSEVPPFLLPTISGSLPRKSSKAFFLRYSRQGKANTQQHSFIVGGHFFSSPLLFLHIPVSVGLF